MGSPVRIIIVPQPKNEYTINFDYGYKIMIKVTPEFMMEPEKLISSDEKIEYIAQQVKEELIKHLKIRL